LRKEGLRRAFCSKGEETGGKKKMRFKSFLTSTYQIWQRKEEMMGETCSVNGTYTRAISRYGCKPKGNNSFENLLVDVPSVIRIFKR
jgi:hypothetical protein